MTDEPTDLRGKVEAALRQADEEGGADRDVLRALVLRTLCEEEAIRVANVIASLRAALARSEAEVERLREELIRVAGIALAREARVAVLREALASLDFLEDDYTRWPWMVKKKVDEARAALDTTDEPAT